MATILTKRSNTASSVPVAGDLTNSTGGAELAVNTADKRLFTKDSGGTVVELGTNPSSITLASGTANAVPYLNGSKVLTTGSALTYDGTTFGAKGSGQIVAVESTGDYSASGAGFIRFKDSTGNRGYVGFGGTSNLMTLSNTVASANLNFELAGSEIARLTSTGLGIGTSSPAWKLDVDGIIASRSGSLSGLRFQTSSNGNNGYVLYETSSNSLIVNNYNAGPITFKTSDAERMRIDSSGNLGLGVTPSAWYSSYRGLQFYGGTIGTHTAARNFEFITNGYHSGSGVYTYLGTDYANMYVMDSGLHKWYNAPSGTAGNAISFTQAMTLDASGNFMVGTTTAPQSFGAANPKIRTTAGGIQIGDYSLICEDRLDTDSLCLIADSSENICFGGFNTGSSTYNERARIDSSGNLLVGTTTNLDVAAQRLQVKTSTAGAWTGWIEGVDRGLLIKSTNSSSFAMYFLYNTTAVGSITTSTTSTSYNTSSDYRLKNTIAPMTGALAKVAALKPCTYKWNADGSDGEGFIAHELAEVVPQCVTGEKDAVDADGNPVYQGIDTSFLVATLTAAIQELKAEFDAYKASHP